MKVIFNPDSHSYWIDGVRASGMTSVAGIGLDSFALDNWRKRQVAIGMAIRPDLAEQVAANFDDKHKVDQLAEEAMQVAQSHVAAAIGTTVHRITERIDLNEPLIETPLSKVIKAAWTAALERAGLTILPDYVERVVVWPEQRLCGMLDRIVWSHSRKRHCILDVKNGANVAKYPHAIAVQLAGYGRAPLMCGPMTPSGRNGSVATEEFFDMTELDIDPDVGYVMHTAGVANGECAEVIEVDIRTGYYALERVVFPALRWRKVEAERLMRPIASAPIPAVEPATDADFARANGDPCPSDQTSFSPSSSPPSPVGERVSATASKPSEPSAPTSGLTTPSTTSTPRTATDVANLSTSASAVTPPAPAPDEGELVPDRDVEKLRAAVDWLPEADKMWVGRMGGLCRQAGYPLNMQTNPATRRRHAIGTALVALAPHADDELTRLLLGVVMGVAPQAIPQQLGTALAALTIDEAIRLADLAGAVGQDAQLRVVDGMPVIEGPAVEAARIPA